MFFSLKNFSKILLHVYKNVVILQSEKFREKR